MVARTINPIIVVQKVIWKFKMLLPFHMERQLYYVMDIWIRDIIRESIS
jgi:hypothetical protein